MKVIDEKVVTYKDGKPVINFTLWDDTTPASLTITGADFGRTEEIAVGSFLLTPSKRYIFGESGAFVELGW